MLHQPHQPAGQMRARATRRLARARDRRRGRGVHDLSVAAGAPAHISGEYGCRSVVPTDACAVSDIAGQIIRDGRVVNSHRAAIGASVASSSTQRGALIVAVQPGGPASSAGIAAGDLVEKIDGSPIADASALGEALGTPSSTSWSGGS